MNEVFTYTGLLTIDEYGCLECGNEYLIESIEEDIEKGDEVFIRYYIADKGITLEQAKTALVVKTVGGNVDALDFELAAYSEYSILDYNEELQVGGHDLFDELQCHDGKYLILMIEKTKR